MVNKTYLLRIKKEVKKTSLINKFINQFYIISL